MKLKTALQLEADGKAVGELTVARKVAKAVAGDTEPDQATVEAYCSFMELAKHMMQQAPTAGPSFTIAGAMSIAIGSKIEGVTSRFEIERTAKEYGKSCERLFRLFALGMLPEPDVEKKTGGGAA